MPYVTLTALLPAVIQYTLCDATDGALKNQSRVHKKRN